MARRYDDDDDDDRDDDMDIGRTPRRRNNSVAAARLSGPAICLMVVIGLHLLLLCIGLPFRILALAGRGVAAAQGNFVFGGNPAVGLGGSFVGLLIQGFLLFGAVQMYRGNMYGVCMATAIISCIPCCSSCLILGIPFGIWALVVLMDDEVKRAFTS
jgi:hypothetical protein